MTTTITTITTTTTHNHQLTSASRASLGFLGLKGPCFLACSTWERKRIPTNLNIYLISYQGFVAEDRLKLVAGDCYHKHTKENLDTRIGHVKEIYLLGVQ